jgi:cholest-4-en-3-one 26-monooxygenase
VMMYTSANRDEEVFANADRFDAGRRPNPHLAFGFGEHFCLGAALARMEGRIGFEEILERYGSIELAGEAVRLPSLIVRGIERLPVVLSA